MTGAAPRIAVLGAGGRVGSLLQRSGAMPGALWLSRRGGEGVEPWDPLAEPAPKTLQGVEVMICLAGATVGPDLSANTRLALVAVDAAAAAGIGHVFIASSIAVYGSEGTPWREDAPLRPQSGYGRAKVDMEAALRAAPAKGAEWKGAGAAASLALGGAQGAAKGRVALQVRPGSGVPQVSVLRMGNVVGADALSAAIAGGQPVMLDLCPGGGSPMRSVIGPVTLGRALMSLAARAGSGAGLASVLNLAQPGPVAMAALCVAAGREFGWRAATPQTLALAALDTGAVEAIVPLPAADPAALIAEWRAAGGLP
ncbi:sugar nucleotide-binding protein [Frigidibacter albus]|uniref:Sugar nucleotide-binding protein n=1 Tax=Frigidibacter albus TaxID=1465486 RepID=A0A6L8VGS5_9RHOB|nr:NAD-dependent epimerase/dehydratase family protein [Frigidibacter albus]MZQ89433.1 sugar nucleotide-binding protein [Frigidibacter albus]NBE31339.1 sugar nucleotide-binding protein [Frigidibacter albus]GGH54126.1 hypothetical protein GCM10011341_20310 [Frigidibacter albus]